MPLAYDAKFRSLPRFPGKKAPWMSYRPASAVPPETPKLQDKPSFQGFAPTIETLPIRKKPIDLAPAEISQIARGLGQKDKSTPASPETGTDRMNTEATVNVPLEKPKKDTLSNQSNCDSDSTVQGDPMDVAGKTENDVFHQTKEEAPNFNMVVSSYESKIEDLKCRIAESAQTITRQIKIIQEQNARCHKVDELRTLLAQETSQRQYAERRLAVLETGEAQICNDTQKTQEERTDKRNISGHYAAIRKRILEAENLTAREREFLTSMI